MSRPQSTFHCLFKRSVEHKHTDFVSPCSLLPVEQSEKSFIFIISSQNSLSIKAFSDLSIILEFLRVQKPIILYQRRSFYANTETADSANTSFQFDMEQQKKQVKQVRDAQIFRKRRRKEAGLEILVRDN